VLIVVLVILGVIALCCAGGVFLGFAFWNKAKGMVGCATHYAEAYQAINRYVADKHVYPPAKTWQDDIVPYWKDPKGSASAKAFLDFGDPNKDLGCAGDDSNPATGMAYNASLAGLPPAKVPSRDAIILFEVAKPGRNIAEPYKTQTGRSPQNFFGKARPWFYITVAGQSSMSDSQNSWSTSTRIDQSSEAPADLGKDAASGVAPSKKKASDKGNGDASE
jgi:hypothetical protein